MLSAFSIVQTAISIVGDQCVFYDPEYRPSTLMFRNPKSFRNEAVFSEAIEIKGIT